MIHRGWNSRGAKTPLPQCSLTAAFLGAATLLATTADGAFAEPSYKLRPQEVATGIYVLFGHQDGLTSENGANIANAGFIVGKNETLLVEAGPTYLYTRQLLETVADKTDTPVRRAVVTHRHPDHAFGINGLREEGIDVLMHPDEAAMHLTDGPALLDLMTELVGEEWTAGTRIDAPSREVMTDLTLDLGGRKVDILVFEGAHTEGDLVVLDRKTGVAFVGDLVFERRAATVPHADIPTWLDTLDRLAELSWSVVVPGHGPLVQDPSMFSDTQNWLRFLHRRIVRAVLEGDSPAEVLDEGVPSEFSGFVESGPTFGRAVLSLYRRYETMDVDVLRALAVD